MPEYVTFLKSKTSNKKITPNLIAKLYVGVYFKDHVANGADVCRVGTKI